MKTISGYGVGCHSFRPYLTLLLENQNEISIDWTMQK
jgi:hypothetical protein